MWNISSDSDFPEYQIERKHSQLHDDFRSHDEFHTIRCDATGIEFQALFHPVADTIEVKDATGSFRLLLEYAPHKDSEGKEWPHHNYSRRIRRGKGLSDFATLLKLTTTPENYEGFEAAQP